MGELLSCLICGHNGFSLDNLSDSLQFSKTASVPNNSELTETVHHYLKAIRGIDGVLDAWISSSTTIYVTLKNHRVVCVHSYNLTPVFRCLEEMQEEEDSQYRSQENTSKFSQNTVIGDPFVTNTPRVKSIKLSDFRKHYSLTMSSEYPKKLELSVKGDNSHNFNENKANFHHSLSYPRLGKTGFDHSSFCAIANFYLSGMGPTHSLDSMQAYTSKTWNEFLKESLTSDEDLICQKFPTSYTTKNKSSSKSWTSGRKFNFLKLFEKKSPTALLADKVPEFSFERSGTIELNRSEDTSEYHRISLETNRTQRENNSVKIIIPRATTLGGLPDVEEPSSKIECLNKDINKQSSSWPRILSDYLDWDHRNEEVKNTNVRISNGNEKEKRKIEASQCGNEGKSKSVKNIEYDQNSCAANSNIEGVTFIVDCRNEINKVDGRQRLILEDKITETSFLNKNTETNKRTFLEKPNEKGGKCNLIDVVADVHTDMKQTNKNDHLLVNENKTIFKESGGLNIQEQTPDVLFYNEYKSNCERIKNTFKKGPDDKNCDSCFGDCIENDEKSDADSFTLSLIMNSFSSSTSSNGSSRSETVLETRPFDVKQRH